MPKLAFKPRKKYPEVQKKEYPKSETVQDDAMEIKEIFSRYNTSMPEKAYPYFDTEDLNDIGRLNSQNIDLTDLRDLQEKTQKLAKKINEEYAKQKKIEQMGDNGNDPKPDSVDDSNNAINNKTVE